MLGRAGEPGTPGLLIGGVALLIAFLLIEHRVAYPMMDLSLIRNRLFCTLVAQVGIVTFPVHVAYVPLALALAMLGLGNGLFNAPNTRAVMGSMPPNRRGVAGGLRMLLNNSGRTPAVAVAMVLLSTVMSYRLLAGLFTGAATGTSILHALAFMDGFHEIFLLGAVISAVAIVCSSPRGSEEGVGRDCCVNHNTCSTGR